MYCHVLVAQLFVLFVTLLGTSLVTGQVGGGDHTMMNISGSGGLTMPAPLQIAPVAPPQPMQTSTQPIQTLPMAHMHELCPQMHETFASQHMHHAYNYNPMLLQDFAAHQQLPMSPISSDETRV